MSISDDFVDDFPVHELPETSEVKVSNGIDAKVIKFPCAACNGTGKYLRVRLHQPRSDCFACQGKGYFLTSERDRQEARIKRRVSKETKLKEARAAFDEMYPNIGEILIPLSQWSPFCAELLSKLNQYGSLSEKQVQAIRNTQFRSEQRQRERDIERAKAALVIDLSPIRTMFETARASGYKMPVYRAAGLVINRASDYGRNPGALYVKNDQGDYLGKIVGTQYTGKPAPALTAIAADPRGEAIKYGQRTGTCSCCGRTLTNEGSIDAGIGPICASKWGL
jgi:hypothetical protein